MSDWLLSFQQLRLYPVLQIRRPAMDQEVVCNGLCPTHQCPFCELYHLLQAQLGMKPKYSGCPTRQEATAILSRLRRTIQDHYMTFLNNFKRDIDSVARQLSSLSQPVTSSATNLVPPPSRLPSVVQRHINSPLQPLHPHDARIRLCGTSPRRR